MFVSGVSPHKIGEVTQPLMGVAPSASAVSRLNQTLTEQFEAWRERPLSSHYRILYLDGVHFTVRHGAQTDSTIALLRAGSGFGGKREFRAGDAGAPLPQKSRTMCRKKRPILQLINAVCACFRDRSEYSLLRI